MDISNDPIALEAEKLMKTINSKLQPPIILDGSNYNRVFEVIYALVKENTQLKTKNITGPFVYNDPRYYCVQATIAHEIFTNFTLSVNVLKRDDLRDLYRSALEYFKTKRKYSIKLLTVYNTESDMHANNKPIANYDVISNISSL